MYTTFADVLDSPTGLIAQLAATTKLLRYVEQGDDLDIAAPLHRHARHVIAQLNVIVE